MSVDIEQELKVFLASAPANLRRILVLEISHSDLPAPYFLWSEPFAGVVETEDGEQAVQCLNFRVDPAGTEAHLDQVYKVTVDLVDPDVGQQFRDALDAIPLDTEEQIACVVREYLSDDLTSPMSRADLQVESVNHQLGAATFTATSPRLNRTRTGILYEARVFPMLRSFL